MRIRKLFRYGRLKEFKFEELPKGNMLEISMNPYNGNVFVKTEKHATSTVIALELMRELVRACDLYERNGSADPLRDLLTGSDGQNFEELVSSAKGETMKAIKGSERRKDPGAEGKRKAS